MHPDRETIVIFDPRPISAVILQTRAEGLEWFETFPVKWLDNKAQAKSCLSNATALQA